MRNNKRTNYLLHSPQLIYSVLIQGRYDFVYDQMPVTSKHMSLAKRINLLKAGINLIYRKSRPWSWPLHMHVELTNYCNLRCQVCPTGRGILERIPKYLDPVLFERLLNEVGPYLLTMSLWGWGESLLHPQLSKILRLVHNRGITTFISTNGQNLDNPSVLDALINYPPTFLIVALDGLTDETISKYRVGAKLAPALVGVKRLAEMKLERGQKFPILHHRFIVMKHNEHEIPRLRQFAIENNFNSCAVRTLSIVDVQDESVHQSLLPVNNKFKAYEYANDERVGRSDFVCEKAFTFPAVFADGTVVDCDQDFNAQQAYGNLSNNNTTFSEIWWSKRASEIRKTIRENMNSFSHCKNCPFKDRSVTDCSILNLDLSN